MLDRTSLLSARGLCDDLPAQGRGTTWTREQQKLAELYRLKTRGYAMLKGTGS